MRLMRHMEARFEHGKKLALFLVGYATGKNYSLQDKIVQCP